MPRTYRMGTVLVISLLALSACTGTEPSPAGSQGSGETPGASAPASAGASAPGASDGLASLEPIPSDDLGAFSCDFPVVEDPTVAIANIVDVRYATHADYDRVVFELFEDAVSGARALRVARRTRAR